MLTKAPLVLGFAAEYRGNCCCSWFSTETSGAASSACFGLPTLPLMFQATVVSNVLERFFEHKNLVLYN